jgi:hypothetical protein
MRRTLFEQALWELEFVDDYLSKYLGRRGEWNKPGAVQPLIWLPPDEERQGIAGHKLPLSCGIALSQTLQLSNNRWATHIHELIHAYSIGLGELSGTYECRTIITSPSSILIGDHFEWLGH